MGIGRELDPKYDFRAMTEPYVGEIISERYQKDAAAQREAFFGGFQAALGTPARVTYLEETMRAIEAGELTLSSRSLGQERGQKALEKRVAGFRRCWWRPPCSTLRYPWWSGPCASSPSWRLPSLGPKRCPPCCDAMADASGGLQ